MEEGETSGGGGGVPAHGTASVAAIAAPVALQGVIGTFDPAQEEWCEYTERLTHYFVASDITSEDKKRAILLTVVGPSAYRLLKTLASPKRLEELRFSELVELAKKHYNPKPSPIVKRFEFNSRLQKEGETIAVYVAELRKIAEHCEYGEVLSDMLRDRLVCGTNNKGIQRRLLLQTELTFDKAMEVALAAEAAEKDSLRLTGGPTDKDRSAPLVAPTLAPAVHKLVHQRKQQNNGKRPGGGASPPGKSVSCYRCGGNHKAPSCPHKDKECHLCHKKGHLAKVCRSKGKKQEPTHSLRDQESPTEELMEYVMVLHSNTNTTSNSPYRALINTNGNPLRMEIDTGASVSVISEETFHTIQRGEHPLQLKETSVQLRTYTGDVIPVRGSVLVPVEHNTQSLTLPLIVTEGSGPSLLGRNWLSVLRLDWQTIFTVQRSASLQQVLDSHSEVFKEGLGELKNTKAKIYIASDEQPRFFKPYSVPFALRGKVEEELERLQALDVIEPVQFSDWGAPIVPVMKPDGRIRICGDYKMTVNRAAKLEKYPIPRIEELFASLAGGKLFTTLDLSHAYLQVSLDEESRQFVTINTHRGLFRYKRLPFGVASAPSIFQRVMESLLQGIPGVCVYIDDILITGSTETEHLHNLSQVLSRLQSAGMRLKKEKCAFLQPSVSYLGHVICAEGLKTETSKVRAIVEAPEPRDVGELRSFLGMVTYYGKFLPDLATTLAPLYRLLRKRTSWRWREKQRKTFRRIKELLHSGRVLTHFDDKLPLVLACDASPYGLGAVLSHRFPNGEERPVGFASRMLTSAETKYSHLDKEALAIIYGVKKFHQYLHGRTFEIKTDHKPLTHIFSEHRGTPTMASARIQRWALTLGGYDYTIQYKEGKNMANADALSRLPLKTPDTQVPKPPELIHLVEHLNTTPLSWKQIRIWTDHDPTLARVRKLVQDGWPASEGLNNPDLQPYNRRRDELSGEGGCVLWGNRVVIPPKGRGKAIQMLHETHPGIVQMKSLARRYVHVVARHGQ